MKKSVFKSVYKFSNMRIPHLGTSSATIDFTFVAGKKH